MKKISELVEWFLDFWPIFGIALFYLIHRILIGFLSCSPFEINSIISSLTQLFGAIITLIIVSKNFSQFRHMNLFSWLKEKINAFPLRKQPYPLEVESEGHAYLSGQVHAYVKKNWDNVDEGLLELERRIDELRIEMKKGDEVLSKEITTVKLDLTSNIIDNTKKIKEVQDLLELSVLDDLHFQVFGALLILYGFFVDIFPNLFR